jgi:hypothetical protein
MPGSLRDYRFGPGSAGERTVGHENQRASGCGYQFEVLRPKISALGRSGGMADAADSKSASGNRVGVQVPPPAFVIDPRAGA